MSIPVRIPRTFHENLKDVIYRHDVGFLEEVCRELRIPFREAKQKILGAGAEDKIILCNELYNEIIQCDIWIYNSKTRHYCRCPAKQTPGHTACEQHKCFHKTPSSKFVTIDKLADLPYLEWIHNTTTDTYMLVDKKTRKLYTAEDMPADGLYWTAPDGSNYILYHGAKKLK